MTWHGTLGGYNNHVCRCPRCRKALRDHQRKYRQKLRSKETPEHVHGTINGYVNYGCRCKRCKLADAAQSVIYYLKKIDKEGGQMLGTAIKIAAEVHEKQTDKGEVAYALHPIEVMLLVKKGINSVSEHMREIVLAVAVLHDTLEDFKPARPGEKGQLEDELYKLLGNRGWSALQALTRWNEESYEDYIERISRDWIARLVKIADLTHNMNVGRLPEGEIGEKDFQRWDKYRRALVRLEREE